MGRSWMDLSRVSVKYRNGVETFLNFAFENASKENMILCPCHKCVNLNFHIREVVYEHLIVFGFVRGYKKWVFHGEKPRRYPPTSNPGDLAHYLGMVARDATLLPINYDSWHEMSDSNKNQAVDYIKEKLSLEVSDDYLKMELEKKWRARKSYLKKKYFKNNLSLEENLRNVPPGILMYQWEDVVMFWSSHKKEVQDRVGVASRQQQKFTHTARSECFAHVADEEEVTSGSNVGRIKGQMTPAAAEIMEKLNDKRTEYEATASTHCSVNVDEHKNQVVDILSPGNGRLAQMDEKITQIQAEVEVREAEREALYKAREEEREAAYQQKYQDLQNQLQDIRKMIQHN
ncbi:hypothetical protein GQ457_18G003310 [Hibiscus cannabinus]